MNHIASVTSRATGRKMTLAELRAFIAACDAHGIPDDTVIQVRTAGFNLVGVHTITATPRAMFGQEPPRA